jgi:hypothetical protein
MRPEHGIGSNFQNALEFTVLFLLPNSLATARRLERLLRLRPFFMSTDQKLPKPLPSTRDPMLGSKMKMTPLGPCHKHLVSTTRSATIRIVLPAIAGVPPVNMPTVEGIESDG